MLGKPASLRLLLGLSIGLLPCMALAVGMPANPLTEAVDTTHLGEVQEGVTARAQAGWTVQVGAYAEREKAEALLEKLAADRPGQLGNAARLITPVEWDAAHTVYRARFAGLSLEAASSLCASLNGAGQACFLSEIDKPEKSALREAALTGVTGGALIKEAPAALVASTAALQEEVVAIPDFAVTAPESVAVSKAPRLVALNDKLVSDKAGRISNDELSGMRGGFFTAGGAQFDFGASIKTMINGQLALQTNLTWTPQGPNISSLTGLGEQIASQVQSDLAKAGINTGHSGNAGTLAVNTPSNLNGKGAASPASVATSIAQPVTNLAAASAAGALGTAQTGASKSPAPTVAPAAATTPQTLITVPTNVVTGVSVPGAGGGSTTVLANIGANQIQNIILNSASNQSINQNTNVTLTIYNLQQWQQQLAQHALSSQLVGEIMAASGLGH